jgi:4-amino-4-deoxy-L-arabinose transferase-like glycosyltransferase
MLGLTIFLLFANLHRGDLAGYDDAVYAYEGKEMLRNGDWANVWLNGKLDFDKPPLFIWLEALSFGLLGVSDFAAKFPAALLGLATVALVYFVTRELTDDEWLPSLAMIVLASTQYFLKYAQHAMTDVPFTFLFTLAIWAYLKAQRQPVFFLLCGSAIGLAGLTRSILGLLPLGVIAAHWLVGRKAVRSVYLWLGLALAIGLPLAWFWTQYHWYGDAFVQHHFSYTAENARSIAPQRGWHWLRGLGEYPFLLVKLYWPWLPLLLGGIVLTLRSLRQTNTERLFGFDQEARWLLLLWIVVVVLPFSLIQHKVLRYILPAFPALAILSALAWRRWIPARRLGASFAIVCVLLSLSVLLISVSSSHRLRAAEVRPLALLADAALPPAQPILLYTDGAARWDYLHQIIWYTDRRAQMLTDVTQTLCQLQQPATAIVDRATYQQHLQPHLNDLEVVGQTSTLVCVRRKSLPQSFTADAKPLPRTTACDYSGFQVRATRVVRLRPRRPNLAGVSR